MQDGSHEPIALERPTRVRWIMFALACAASSLLYLHRYSWGVIKPQFRRDFPELTDADIGWLDSAFLASYALGQVPGGLAGDWLGPRAVLAVIILLWSAAVAGVAWTSGFWRVGAVRAGFGLAQAGAYPVISKMTRIWFPLDVRTSVQGVVASLGRIGGACSSLVIATLLIGLLGLSWQHALIAIMAPGVLLAIAWWWCVRDNPGEHPWANAAERQLLDAEPKPYTGAGDAATKVRLRYDAGAGLSLGMLLVYAFASTFQDQLYVFWIPLFLAEARGLDPVTMGLFAPLPLIGGAIGGVIGGILNDALIRVWGNRRWSRSLVGCTGKLVAAVLVYVTFQVPDGRLAMVVLMAARFFGDWSLPTQWGAITDMGGRASATLFGLVNTVGALGGFAAGPCLGYLKLYYGWEGLFWGVVAMCLVASVTWLFIDCTKRLARD
ncbi:MAG: MFS transporter [Gemmataceae bacterium]|nr:MFS transporter [Gemmataceae bacterium]